MVGNFIFWAIKEYLAIGSSGGDQVEEIPKVVKTIVKLVMRTVIKTNTNIAELLVIIRKILGLK